MLLKQIKLKNLKNILHCSIENKTNDNFIKNVFDMILFVLFFDIILNKKDSSY